MLLYVLFCHNYSPLGITTYSNYCLVVKGVIDVTTTEVADYVVGGVMACGPNRFQALLQQRIPLVLSVGALDMVNFGNKSTVPEQFANRQFHAHNDQVS